MKVNLSAFEIVFLIGLLEQEIEEDKNYLSKTDKHYFHMKLDIRICEKLIKKIKNKE